jgi:hypothetical protein
VGTDAGISWQYIYGTGFLVIGLLFLTVTALRARNMQREESDNSEGWH